MSKIDFDRAQISLEHRASIQSRPVMLLAFAWITTLLISTLPNIIWQEFIGTPPAWLFWAKIIFLAALVSLTFAWQVVRPLRPYFAIFLVLYLAEEALGRLGTMPMWRSWFGGSGVSFSRSWPSAPLRPVVASLYS